MSQTKLTPFLCPNNTDLFAAKHLSSTVVVDGSSYFTAPLQFGIPISLLKISSTTTLLETGVFDHSDSIASTAALRCFYVQIGKDILKFTAEPTEQAVFSVVQPETSRVLELSYLSLAHRIDKNTVCFDDTPLKTLAFMTEADFAITLAVNMHGIINVETGMCKVELEKPRLFSLERDEPGCIADKLAPEYKTLMSNASNAIDKIEGLGYELDLYRVNLNRR